MSPVVRGAGSGLETWWWVVSDQRVQRRPAERPRERDKEAKPDPAPAPQAPSSGPEPSANPEEFTAPRSKTESEKPEGDEAEADAEMGPPRPAFIIADDRDELEELLAPYADRPVPLGEDVRQRWLESGLRVYAVPQEALYGIEQRLRLVAPVQRQWMGEMPMWTDIAAGPWLDRGSVVMVAGHPVRLAPGRLRLIARAWTAPISGREGPRPGLRLEVVPQHEPMQTEQQKLLEAAGLINREDARGLAFDRLAVGVTLQSDDALVIVPLSRETPEDERVEPFREDDRLLGEAMLSREASEERARARAIIVLVPRLAERFELLGR